MFSERYCSKKKKRGNAIKYRTTDIKSFGIVGVFSGFLLRIIQKHRQEWL
jgi:hypothetical protein